MDPATQNILRECADRLIQTADLIARSSPAASTSTTASSASPAIAASSSTTASSQPNAAPSAVSTARAEHARLFGYQPPSGNPRSRSNNGRRPPRINRVNLPYNRGQTWTRTFVCLASSASSQLPTPAERVTLALNNLGEKKIEFPKNGNGTQVHQCIVEQFPQLDQHGYSILRTTSESGRSRDLMQIPMPPAGFSVDYLKSVLGQAKAYLRPLQGNIHLKDNKKDQETEQGDGQEEAPAPLMLNCLNCHMPYPMSEFQGHLEQCGVAGPSQPSISRSGRIEQYLHTESSSVQHLQQLIPDASAKDIEEALEVAKGDTNAAVDHLLNSQDLSGSAKGNTDAGSRTIDTESAPVTPLAYEIDDDDNDDQDLLRHSWIDDTSNSKLCKDHDFSTLPDILDVLEKKLTGPDMSVEVDQNAVVVKALTIYKDPKFDMTRPFKVSFNNQPALDVGGPKREFFSILFEELTEMDGKPLPGLFEGNPKRLLPLYNSSIVYSGVFVAVGKMIAHSIAQCGVGFPYLAPCAYWYIVTDDISKAVGYVTIEDIRDIQVVEAITKLSDGKEAEDMRNDASLIGLLSDAGCRDLPSQENRQLCVESLILSTLNKKKTVLDQLVKGLQALDVLDHIRRKPILFEPLFVNNPTEDLTAGRVMSVLSFTEDEAPSKEHLLRFIGDSCKSDMQKFIRYCSGGTTLPRKLTVVFDEGGVIFSSTCMVQLHLPRAVESYEIFKLAIESVISDRADAFNSM